VSRVKTVVLVAVALIGLCCAVTAAETVKRTVSYLSPDKQFRAEVITQAGSSETVVEVHNRTGKLLSREDYTSDDAQHGYYVSKAEWTPNSQFFVYSLESSGGHFVMVVPTLFFATRTKKTYQLFDYLKSNVIFPDFQITAPDKVRVTTQDSQRPVVVSLSELLKRKKPITKSQ
jgi:hypothetical protein